MFGNGRLTPLRQAWQSQRVRPIISRVTVTELIRVLAYPKFNRTADEQQELLADYRPCCKAVRIPEPPPKTPPCRDVFDIPLSLIYIFIVTGAPEMAYAECGCFSGHASRHPHEI